MESRSVGEILVECDSWVVYSEARGVNNVDCKINGEGAGLILVDCKGVNKSVWTLDWVDVTNVDNGL